MDLVNRDSDKYESQGSSHILEQWKTCVEMANNNSERRLANNNIFIAISAAIIALTSFTPDWKSIVMSFVGVFVSIIWINSIKSYKELNKVKYKIINNLEEFLPTSPFKYEWSLINEEGKYRRLTYLESIVPYVFISLYVLCMVTQIFHIICSPK